MNIYLDIDGVILANDKQAANFAKEFIKYIVSYYPVYWLSTHCRGDSDYTVNHINKFFDIETIEYLKKIKPTNWNQSKTEAIDFTQPFLWFEDDLFDFEKEDLDKHGALSNWIEVNLSKNVNQLEDIIQDLQSKKLPIG